MRRLELDYGRSDSLQRRLGLALLLAGLGATGLVAIHYRTVSAESARWEAQVASLEEGTQQAGKFSRQEVATAQQLGIDIRQANEVVEQLNVPWETLFQAVESADSKQVALLSIEPDAGRHEVKIGGEAKDLPAMLDYVRQLGQQAAFPRVHLQNHEVQEQDPEKPIRFTVLATWQS